MPRTDGLTPKEERFVLEYLIDFNGTRAALAAGYAAKSAAKASSELLRRPRVISALAGAREKHAERCEVTKDRVIAELAKLGFSNMADFMSQGAPDQNPGLDLRKITRDQAAAIHELTIDSIGPADGPIVMRTKLKLSDKRGALELLGKHLGIFSDKLELTGKDGTPLGVVMIPHKETIHEAKTGD